MTGFQTQTMAATPVAPDVHKHVKFSLGMVLGVDDFDQEFAYLANRDQWYARDTIGYGTLCGLRVTTEDDGERGPRVLVQPGVALSPHGELIRVTPAQCAYLNDWLTANRAGVVERLGSPPTDPLTLYVVLCYRPCPTDLVPIPGEPCRDETQATAASRVQDEYDLRLSFSAPDQIEERAVRGFVDWLSQIEVSDAAVSTDLEEFLQAVRDAPIIVESPPGSPLDPTPGPLYGSPPAELAIHTIDACEYLRAALRVWVTDVRPRFRGAACEGSLPAERCVLLAEIDLTLLDGLVAGAGSALVHEDDRPFVVHLRLLQEWLTCGPRLGGAGLAPASDVEPENVLDGHLPSVGIRVGEYALSDHTHGAPADPIPDHQADPAAHMLGGDVTGPISAATVVRLQGVDVATDAPALTEVLTFESNAWRPAAVNINGDATGPALGNTVQGIQHVAIDPNPPTLDGQVLTYDEVAKHWTPRSPTGGPGLADVVEHPAGLPSYFIEAAGIVSVEAQRQPIYNGLAALDIRPADSEIGYRFDTYVEPNPETHQYIVKAIPVWNPEFAKESTGMVSVSFTRFEPELFYLRLTDDFGNPLNEEELRQIEMMIEVSRFEAQRTDREPRVRVNLNTSSAAEISRNLPRIGPALARRIVTLRRQRGGAFASLNDLIEVQGIDAATLRFIEPFVTL